MPAKAGTQRLSVPSRHSRFRGNDGEGSRTMNTAVTDYLAHLEVERRMSAHTLDAYRRDLAALSEWAQAQGIVDLETLQPGQLRAFVAAEHRRGLSPKSLRSEAHTSALQSLMRPSYAVFCLK